MAQYRQQADDLITRFGSFTTETLTSLVDDGTNVVSVSKLARHLIMNTLELANDVNDDNEEVNEVDEMLIKNFVNELITTIAHLLDLFDFDGNQEVELVNIVEEEGSRHVELGNDVKAFINSTGLSSLVDNGTVQDKIMTILTSLLLTMNNEQIAESHEDIVNFRNSINSAYAALKELKGLNVKPAIVSRKDDIMSFIITFVVVLLPVLTFVNSRVASSNTEEITNEQVTQVVHTAYGNKLDLIILLANDLTKKTVKVIDAGFKGKVKKLFKCC